MAEDRTYLKLDGIEGESTDTKFSKQIQVIGEVAWSVANHGAQMSAGYASGGSGGAKADFSPITFMKSVDKGTPKLMTACATGKPIAKAVFSEIETAGDGTSSLRRETTLEDVMVTAVHRSGGHDQITIHYQKIEFKFIERDGKGNATPHSAKFDVAKAEKG